MSKDNESGIALVIVLGFLSILTIMAMGFAISMRTERLVSEAHSGSVSARQFSSSALARALGDIDVVVSTNRYPDFTSAGSLSTELLYSRDGSTELRAPSVDALLDFVPGALSNEIATIADDIGWEMITNNQGEEIGRIAYVVANCSGLICLNATGCRRMGKGNVPT